MDGAQVVDGSIDRQVDGAFDRWMDSTQIVDGASMDDLTLKRKTMSIFWSDIFWSKSENPKIQKYKSKKKNFFWCHT